MEFRERKQLTKTQLSVDPILNQVLQRRNVQSPADLEYSLRGLLSPRGLLDVDVAAQILADAILFNRNVLVIGDYDCDGATGTAIMTSGLAMLGAKRVKFLVPDRFRHGYGLTPSLVEIAAEYEPDVIVTVDSGITSLAGAEAIKARLPKTKLIITDHHLPLASGELPTAAAIVNPQRPGDQFESKCIAGCGVAWYTIAATRAAMREMGKFRHQPEPDIRALLDLVAIGIVADVVSLDHNNRTLVNEGIEWIRRGAARPGIRALIRSAGVDERKLTSTDIAFRLAPRLNAAGRLDDMTVGIRCLLEHSVDAAMLLAQQLDAYNKKRKEIESSMKEQAFATLSDLADNQVSVVVHNEQWHEGVVGIVASRIKESYNRPAICFASTAEGTLKGSGRSIEGFHLKHALDEVAARYPQLLQKYGGHAMAAGLTIASTDLVAFAHAFETVTAQYIAPAQVAEKVIEHDGDLPLQSITPNAVRAIHNVGPWGSGFPQPRFHGSFEVARLRYVGASGNVAQMQLKKDGTLIKGVLFNADKETLMEGGRVEGVYQLSLNEFNGNESAELIFDAIRT